MALTNLLTFNEPQNQHWSVECQKQTYYQLQLFTKINIVKKAYEARGSLIIADETPNISGLVNLDVSAASKTGQSIAAT